MCSRRTVCVLPKGLRDPLVREGGFEPPRLAAVDFESTASTVPPLSQPVRSYRIIGSRQIQNRQSLSRVGGGDAHHGREQCPSRSNPRDVKCGTNRLTETPRGASVSGTGIPPPEYGNRAQEAYIAGWLWRISRACPPPRSASLVAIGAWAPRLVVQGDKPRQRVGRSVGRSGRDASSGSCFISAA
jgi:hypothetical protein